MPTLINILTNESNAKMQYEIAVMLCAFFITAALLKDRKRVQLAWGGIFLFFIYIHRILLPFLISGLCLFLLAGLAALLVRPRPGSFLAPVRYFKKQIGIYTGPEVQTCTAVILTILLIQLCRINIAIDYDSLRYGLRSDVLLTDGMGIKGFFTNTGLVNSVYLYPKGYELLTRPLYFGGTLGNVLCVNLWMLIAALLLTGELAGSIADSDETRVFAALMASIMPGITNMSVTAKSDLATLVCQLGFLYCAMVYAGRARRRTGTLPGAGSSGTMAGSGTLGSSGSRHAAELPLFGIGTGALILSYALKPTAIVFSSVTGLAVLAWYLVKKIRIRVSAADIRVIAAAAVFTGVITLRTLLITGQPFAGVFTGLFEKMGFALKYPFRTQSFLYTEEALSFTDKIRIYLTRVFGFLICPAGEDLHHVIMAWGGIAFLLMLLLIAVFLRGTAGRMEDLDRLSEVESSGVRFNSECFRFLEMIFAVIGVLSLICLYLLYQVDGNYFMLLYSLTAALGTVVLTARVRFEQSGLGRNFKKVLSGGNNAALILLCVVMIWTTAFTGWAGAVGFTEADFINRGYYSHDEELKTDPGIWGPYDRVVAFAYEPDCYCLPGRLESWVDIDGSGGNVYLTDTKLNIFKRYLTFADIDYIYADLNYLNDTRNPRRERAGVLFTYLLEDGCFEELIFFHGSSHQFAARIDKERIAVDWEVPMTEAQTERTKEQTSWFHEIN